MIFCANFLFNAIIYSTGSGRPAPDICGTNTGHHMYLDYGPSDGSGKTISVTHTLTASTFERYFRFKVSYIPCYTRYTPPAGCLQYVTGVSGDLKSFNFDGLVSKTNNQYYKCVYLIGFMPFDRTHSKLSPPQHLHPPREGLLLHPIHPHHGGLLVQAGQGVDQQEGKGGPRRLRAGRRHHSQGQEQERVTSAGENEPRNLLNHQACMYLPFSAT